MSASDPHPSKDYLFHATRKLQPIGLKREPDGAATTTVRCFDVYYVFRRGRNFARVCPEGRDPEQVTVRRLFRTEFVQVNSLREHFTRRLIISAWTIKLGSLGCPVLNFVRELWKI